MFSRKTKILSILYVTNSTKIQVDTEYYLSSKLKTSDIVEILKCFEALFLSRSSVKIFVTLCPK